MRILWERPLCSLKIITVKAFIGIVGKLRLKLLNITIYLNRITI